MRGREEFDKRALAKKDLYVILIDLRIVFEKGFVKISVTPYPHKEVKIVIFGYLPHVCRARGMPFTALHTLPLLRISLKRVH